MIELTFVNGRLRQGETELARIGFDAHLVSNGREYRIVRTARHGWHYAVTEPGATRRVCEFAPFRIRRGGRLRSGSTTLLMRGRLFRRTGWRFTTDGGSRIEATSTHSWSDRFRFSTVLRAEDSIAAMPNAPIALALGCWLIAFWENSPALPADLAPGFPGPGI